VGTMLIPFFGSPGYATGDLRAIRVVGVNWNSYAIEEWCIILSD